MLNAVNKFIDRTPMYRIVIYSLAALAVQALFMSALGLVGFGFFSVILSLTVLLAVNFYFNRFIASFSNIPTNDESALITALILFFIYLPTSSLIDLIVLSAISAIAMLSKYLFVHNKTHLFNPAAFASLAGTLLFKFPAVWWIGSSLMLPLTVVAGYVITKKLGRGVLISTFIVTALSSIYANYINSGTPITDLTLQAFLSWPTVFFATVMLTEPFTLPGRKKDQLIYAVVIGLLFGSKFQFGILSSTPEVALLVGNALGYFLNTRARYVLILKEINKLNESVYELVFTPDRPVNFKPGQYMEWMLDHDNPDSRGKRRYFTISSSPSEDEIKIGVKVNKEGSSYKQALTSLNVGDVIYAEQLAGDFTLRGDNKAYVFIAGGIGITPFRSILQDLLDRGKKVTIDVFYSANSPEDYVYKNVLLKAAEKLGTKVHFLLSSPTLPQDWHGLQGHLDLDKLKNNVPDYTERLFYISGPNTMVQRYKSDLVSWGIPKSNIVTDAFSGFS